MHIQWEYQRIKMSGGSLLEGLNTIGKDGWQAVTIDMQSDAVFVIAKRPKELTLPNMGDVPFMPAAKGRQ